MNRQLRDWVDTPSANRLGLSLIAVTALVLGTALSTSSAAQATVPGTPGVPQASTVVYAEDFQNRPGPTPIVRLDGYTGSTGVTYTAAAPWLSTCNGWIASAAQSVTAAEQIADCMGSQNSWNTSQRLAQAIGMFRGQTDVEARDNFADTAFTAGNPGGGLVEFQTAWNIPFVASNRFINFSVDVAAVNCAVSAPLLQFSLLDGAGTATNVGSPIDACSASTTVTPPALGVAPASAIRVGTYASDGALLFTGSSVGVRMVNENPSGLGNDHTIDNLRIIDVTPQLDKLFNPTTRVAGQVSTLTLTVTNTSELAAKNGWSFTDTLPAGLTVAGAASTTCPAPTLTAPAGGSSIALTASLSAGMESCTVTVPVTSDTAGTYTNGPSNITSIGLNPPAEASVTFVEQAPVAPPGGPVTSDPGVGRLANTGLDARLGLGGAVALLAVGALVLLRRRRTVAD